MSANKLGQETKVEFRQTSAVKPIIGSLLIILTVAAYVFYVRPFSASVDVLRADITAKEEEVKTLTTKVQQYEAATKELGLSSEVERFEVTNSIPVGVRQDEVIRDLIDIAELNKISLSSLSFGKGKTQKEGISSLRISSSFSGSYEDLLDFLKSIEQNARLLRINSINVQLTKLDVLALERATFSLSMEAFFQE